MQNNQSVTMLNIDELIPNRYQPRKVFDEASLDSLASSIKTYGIINPILVRKKENQYEIIAGERRYRAAKKIGLTEVPVIIKDASEQQMAELALIENIQRQELSAMEEAKSYEEILRLGNHTQASLAEKLGKSQSAIANKIRLLSLPEEIQEALSHKKISERHARSLLAVPDKEKQLELLNRIITEKLTVKETEQIINESEINEQEITKAINDIMKSLKNKEDKEDKKEDDNMNNGNFFPNFDANNTANTNNTSLNMMNMQSMGQPTMSPSQESMQPVVPPLAPYPATNTPSPEMPGMSQNVEQTMAPQSMAQPQPEVNNTLNQPINPMPSLDNFSNQPNQNFTNPVINDAPLFGVEPMTPQPTVDTPQVSIPIVDAPLFNPNVTMPEAPKIEEPTPMVPPQLTPLENFQTSERPEIQPTLSTPEPVVQPPAFEIPVTNQQEANVVLTTDKLSDLENFLATNGYTYKNYSNDTTTCIIIELPKN